MRRRQWFTIWFLAMATAAASAAVSAAPPQPAAPADGTVRFRRHYVPIDEIEQHVRQGYMPLRRDRFAQMLDVVNAQQEETDLRGARLESAVYASQWSGDELTGGTAQLKVVRVGRDPSVLSLGECGLALGRVWWDDDQSDLADVGRDPDGNLIALVDRTGLLRFRWSLRGRQGRNGGVSFTVHLPPSPMSRLVLTLPKTMMPLATAGVVQPVSEGGTIASAEESTPDMVADGDNRQWQIDLGGTEAFELNVVPTDRPSSPPRKLLATQHTVYAFRDSGAECQTVFELDGIDQARGNVLLESESALEIVEVRVGEEPIALSAEEGQGAEQEGRRRWRLPLPETSATGHSQITISGLMAWPINETFPLPEIRLLGAAWKEQSIRVDVPDTLELTTLSVEGGKVIRVDVGEDAAASESHYIQLFDESAKVQVRLAHRSVHAEIVMGTTVDVSESLLTSRLVAQMSAVRGEMFTIEAHASPGWFVDRVQMLVEEGTQEHQQIVSWYQRGRQLRVHLQDGLRPGHPLEIEVAAHRRFNSGTIGGDAFRVLQFPQFSRAASWMCLRSESPYQLQLSNDGQLALLGNDAGQTAPMALLDPLPDSIVYQDTPAADELVVRVRRQDPRYTASISIVAAAQEDGLRETFRIRCVPQSSQLRRLLVHFTETDDSLMTWRLVDGDDADLVARRIFEPAEAAPGETWELAMLRPRSQPFEIEAIRHRSLQPATALTLVSVPEAVSQSGLLTIESLTGTPLLIEASNVKGVPPPIEAGSKISRVRGIYQFDPGSKASVIVRPAADKAAESAAWAWQAVLETRLDPNGGMTHMARFYLENTGLRRVAVQLPEHALHVRGFVDGQPVSLPAYSASSHRCWIRLPREVRFPVVVLTYRTSGNPQRFIKPVRPLWPQLDLPCLQRSTSLWLPPDYATAQDGRMMGTMGSASWDERLFGIQLWRREGRPFNVLSTEDWAAILPHGGRTPRRDTAERTAHALAKGWNTLVQQGRTATWKELLIEYQRFRSDGELQQILPEIVVDEKSLAWHGIGPQTILPAPTGRYRTWDELMVRKGVVICVTPQAALMTTRGALARMAEPLERLTEHDFIHIAPRLSLSALARSTAPPLALRTIDQWSEVTSAHPWNGNGGSADMSLGLPGWHNVWFETSKAPKPIWVYSQKLVDLISWGGALMVAGLMGWWLRLFPAHWSRWLAATALIALLCPEECVPLARGLFIGTALAILITLLPRPERRRRVGLAEGDEMGSLTSASTVRRRLPVTTAIWFTLVAAVAQGLLAQPAPQGNPTDSVFTLLDPVDDQGQTAGNYVYVPRPFYDFLYRSVSDATEAPRSWLIQSANYTVELHSGDEPASPMTPGVNMDRGALVRVDWDVDVYRDDSVVELPFDRREIQVLEVLLDGQEIQPLWTSAGTSISVPVAAPGRVRISLSIRPLVVRRGLQSSFDFAIPAMARSRLRVRSNVPLAMLELPTARGGIAEMSEQGEVTADLGPASRLAVQWEEKAAGAPVEAEISQLLFLHVYPQSLILEAQFTVQVQQGRFDLLELRTDPRLELISWDPSSPIARIRRQDGPLKTYRMTLVDTGESEMTVRLTFLVSGATGIGTVSIPTIYAAESTANRCWAAIWISPLLDAQWQVEQQGPALGVDEFLTLWGEEDVEPRWITQTPTDVSSSQFICGLREARTLCRAETDYSLGHERVSFSFRARLEISDGACLQQRLKVPAAWRIREIRMTRDGVEHVLRWANSGDGVATVFFDEPLQGEYLLRVTGEGTLSDELPVVYVMDAELEQYDVQLYRLPAVQVAVGAVRGMTTIHDTTPGAYDPQLGRRAAHLRFEQPADLDELKIPVRVSPNRPQLRGYLVTALRFEDDRWMVHIDVRMRVLSGMLDELRWELPLELGEPMQVTPDLPLQLHKLYEGRRCMMWIRPDQPWENEVQLQLRCPLGSTENRVQLPDIQLRSYATVRQFVVLPTQLGSQQIAWRTSGLQSMALPRDYQRRNGVGERALSFLVVGRRKSAVIRDVDRMTGAPHVALASINLSWFGDGSCFSVATFDLEPTQLSHVEIEMPPNLHLLQSMIDGHPVVAQLAENGHWSLPLGSVALPQRIELLVTGQLSARTVSGTSRVFPAPVLVGLPVEQTIWTVRSPATAGAAEPLLPHARADAARLALIRYERMASLLESEKSAGAGTVGPRVDLWLDRWQRRLYSAGERLRALGQRVPETGKPDTQEPPSDGDEEATAEKASLLLWEFQETWPVLDHVADSESYAALRGATGQLVMTYREGGATRAWLPAAAVLLLVIGGYLAKRFLRVGELSEWLLRWPHLMVVILGICWWLWLQPSWVGWLVILLALIGAMRGPAAATA